MRGRFDRSSSPTGGDLNVDEPSSIQAWARAFCVDEETLVKAIRMVGADLRDIRIYLARSGLPRTQA
jgi:hypothetical protein